MPDPLAPKVTGLYRYPVKGFSAEALENVELAPGRTFPLDRAYAVEAGGGKFDPAQPQHLPKIHFLQLMRNARLAALNTQLDPESHVLTIIRDGSQVARGDLKTPIGRQLIEQFLAGYMQDELRGPPKIVAGDGVNFTDKAQKCIHIVNLASLREVERAFDREVDPLRFRPNIVVEAETPWVEFGWLEEEIAIGNARLKVIARTGRCEATSVDPKSGVRDMAVPAGLMRTYGHDDFGVYAVALNAATINLGDEVSAAA